MRRWSRFSWVVLGVALAVLVRPEAVQRAVNFLTAQQRADGSWNGQAYETALAVRAIAFAFSEPLCANRYTRTQFHRFTVSTPLSK